MSGTSDFIPGGDDEFHTFAGQFASGARRQLQALGLTEDDLTEIDGAMASWSAAHQACIAGRAQAHALTEAKNQARAAAEKVIRGKAKKINAAPGVDNALRATVGLPDHDPATKGAPAPTTRPLVRLEATGHFALTLHLTDEARPASKAKPAGVHACKIYRFVGDAPPADPASFVYVADVTRTTIVDMLPAADAGKTVHYACRWVNAKMEPGPWSDIASAKIPV
jgi:hypothetical protein